MKKIIRGYRYNTDTATLVHKWADIRYMNDFRFRSKKLYITKSGSWFLHHKEGSLTDMATSSNSTSGSEDIEPLTPDEAFRFLCTHDGEEAAEKYFPEKIVDA
jgi:hypothetical protein